MVADPDVEIGIDHLKKIAEPLSYQARSVRNSGVSGARNRETEGET